MATMPPLDCEPCAGDGLVERDRRETPVLLAASPASWEIAFPIGRPVAQRRGSELPAPVKPDRATACAARADRSTYPRVARVLQTPRSTPAMSGSRQTSNRSPSTLTQGTETMSAPIVAIETEKKDESATEAPASRLQIEVPTGLKAGLKNDKGVCTCDKDGCCAPHY
jgi:hypothetical protein